MQNFSEILAHHPETQPFWDGLKDGRFLLRHCQECDRAHWYPRPICPHCGSADTAWREASGGGEIYSYSVSRTVAEPYAIAYVRLAEGPIMMTRIVGDADAVRIGKAVALAPAAAADGTILPFFKLT